MLHSIFQLIWETQQWPQNWKMSVSIPIPKKDNYKECSKYHIIALISHSSKVILKFSKSGFSSTWTVNFQIFKLVLENAEEPEIKSPTSVWSTKKHESSRKILLLYWLCQSLWQCGSQQTVENSERDGNTRAPDLPPEKSIYRPRSNS